MPAANKLSTVEWHKAQVTPTLVSMSLALMNSTLPLRPTTASSFSKATVPFLIPATAESRCTALCGEV